MIPPLLALEGLKFVLFECNPKAVQRSLWNLIADAGFTLFGIEKSAFATRLKVLARVSDVTRQFDDLVAAPIKNDSPIFEILTPRQLAQLLATTRAEAPV